MTSKAVAPVELPNVPSYDEIMNGSTTAQMYPNLPYQPQPSAILQQYEPKPVQNMQPIVHNIHIGGLPTTCSSCQKPLHTRIGYVSTCSTHCGFLVCCLFLCWPCAPFVYCTKSCREPRLFCVNCGEQI